MLWKLSRRNNCLKKKVAWGPNLERQTRFHEEVHVGDWNRGKSLSAVSSTDWKREGEDCCTHNLSTIVYHVPGIEHLVVNKTDKNSCPPGAYISAAGQRNKWTYNFSRWWVLRKIKSGEELRSNGGAGFDSQEVSLTWCFSTGVYEMKEEHMAIWWKQFQNGENTRFPQSPGKKLDFVVWESS